MKRTILFGCLSAVLAGAALAQPPPDDPIAQQLFPPELVMRHSHEIGLDEKQRAAIKEAIQKSQAKFTDAQWDLQEEAGRLARLLQATPVDEGAALTQAEKVMGLEREVKKAQLTLLIRVKNQLTGAQQAKLRDLRGQASR